MRAAVLGGTEAAGNVDTQYVYATTTDGSDLTDVYGPLHTAQIGSGARGHATMTGQSDLSTNASWIDSGTAYWFGVS